MDDLLRIARACNSTEDLCELVRLCLRRGIGPDTDSNVRLFDEQGKRVTTKAWSRPQDAVQAAKWRGNGRYRIERHVSMCVDERWIQISNQRVVRTRRGERYHHADAYELEPYEEERA